MEIVVGRKERALSGVKRVRIISPENCFGFPKVKIGSKNTDFSERKSKFYPKTRILHFPSCGRDTIGSWRECSLSLNSMRNTMKGIPKHVEEYRDLLDPIFHVKTVKISFSFGENIGGLFLMFLWW